MKRKKLPADLRFPFRVTFYTDKQGAELVRQLADRWQVSESAVLRRLVREAARREGLAEGEASDEEPAVELLVAA